jgi:hypothetical protein
MALAALLLLAPMAVQPGAVPADQPVRSQSVQVRAVASAEVLRSGQIGGTAGSETLRPAPRTAPDGRVLWEFR